MKTTKTETGYRVTDDQEKIWYVSKTEVQHLTRATRVTRWLITDHDGKSVMQGRWTRQFATKKECLDWIRAQH